MKIKLRQDSRDSHAYRHFGQTNDYAPVNFDDPNIPEKIQPPGNIQCVLYTSTYIAQNRTKKEYDIDELYSRVPHYSGGTDVREVFGEIVKVGLKVKGTDVYEKPFSTYFRADTGGKDSFDNARSAMTLAQSPIAVASLWYSEWMNLGPNAVMPIGKTPITAHMYADKGWEIKGIVTLGGEPMFVIEPWIGHTLLMPRATFNEAMKVSGVGAWVLSTVEIDVKRVKTLSETLRDLCVNAIILLKRLLIVKTLPPNPEPMPSPTKPNMIIKWRNLIKIGEAARPDSHNGGNLKYTPLTASWGGKKGRPALDGGYFCKFDNDMMGDLALDNFLIMGCKNQLLDFHKPEQRKLAGFMKKYAGGPPQGYIDGIVKGMGVSGDTDISTFLT